MERYKKIKQVVVRRSDLKDEDFIRELRNNPALFRFSSLVKRVKKVEHHHWFLNLLREHYSYTVYLGKIKVGHIRFHKIKSQMLSVGIAILPEYSGQGIGPKALKRALADLEKKEASSEIIAEVKEDNLPSQKFFTKMGFKLSHFVYKYKL